MLQVDNSFLLVISSLFSSAWTLIRSFNIPGTNINVAEFAIAVLVLAFIFRHVFPLIHLPSIQIDVDSDKHTTDVSFRNR